MLVGPNVVRRAQLIERLIADLEQSALLEIRRGDSPAAAQVTIEPVSKYLPQGAVRVIGLRETDCGIARV